MSRPAVLAYPHQGTAEQAAAALARMRTEYLIQLDDVAWVTKSPEGKSELHQGSSRTGPAAASSASRVFPCGLLVLVLVAGMTLGAATGAVVGRFADTGIGDRSARGGAAAVPPGGSALFVPARHATAERVLPEMATFGGRS
jgi:uncharacterized membrane protein